MERHLTPDAKNQLSRTIRALRSRLLTDLNNAAESTYRLSIAALDRAGLAEEQWEKRRRLETWLDEQVRAEVAPQALSGSKLEKAKAEIQSRSLHNALKLAAATLLNRLIVIRQMEALGLLRTKVVTGGWSSPAYREFRDFAPDLCKDDTEGYGFLLQLLYDELALDLPGLFGRVGLTELFPIPASTLRAVIEALEALDPDTWRDDTTLGWVYQYWNDPEREALDDKLNSGGKVAPHEIASKTQMFTERYMVEWLLHNSLGQQWLAICQQNGWTPEAVADGTLDALEVRRQDWREQRDRGEVALDALMPLETEQEERWKYWVKQPPLVAQTSITSPLAPLHEVERGTGTSPLTPLHGMERGTGSVEEAQGNENVSTSTSPSPQVERGPGGEVQVERGPGGEVAPIPGYIYQLCRELRSQQTPAEEALWSVLRNRQFNDLKFRRQHPLGRYIADFYCAEKRLVVELDGAVHQKPEQQTYDQIRNEELEARDLTVLRISNSEVEENLEGVLAKILTGCNAPSADFTSPLAPLHSVERGTGTSPLAPLHSVERRTGNVGDQGEEKVFSSSSPSPLVERGPGGEVNSGAAKTSIRHLKLLDPACGSGHFLIIAFDLLFAFYQEEARHRGETWSDQEIVESILTNNLHGLDLDPRAVQIAAAALYLKAKALCPQAELTVLNLVAANLNLAALPEDDPALVELRQAVTASTGIPEELTNQIVQGLKGADAWGSLLKVDDAVDGAIASYEWQQWKQGELFAAESPLTSPLTPLHTVERGTGSVEEAQSKKNVSRSTSPSPQVERGPGGEVPGERGPGGEVKALLIAKLERFLTLRTRGDDLGLRLRGEQLAAGVRFLRLVREGAYDLVIGNPPYQGTSKMKDAQYVATHYPKAKADLYAVFLQRGLELAKPGGLSALLTMRNWMFISQYSAIREFLIDTYDLRLLGDIDRGGFEDVLDEVVSTVMSVFRRADPTKASSIATQPTPLDDNSRDRYRTNRKRAAVLAQVGRYEFQTQRFNVIQEKPIIYWWNKDFLKKYESLKKIGESIPARQGLTTGDNVRFLRFPWEVDRVGIHLALYGKELFKLNGWFPIVKGAQGRLWIEPVLDLVLWRDNGLEIRMKGSNSQFRNESFYFRRGVAFTTTGAEFGARVYRFCAIFENKGRTIFSEDMPGTLALLNSQTSKNIAQSLNPTIDFTVGDVNRLPLFPIESADEIFAQLDRAFTEHEAARETSVEFQQPGPSCWVYAQAWAQQAVDRSPGAPLPPWQPQYDHPPAAHWVSYALGLALGRFPLTPLSPGRGAGGEGSGVSGPHPPNPLLPGREKGEQEDGSAPLSQLGRGAGGEGEPLPGETHPPFGKPLSRLHPLTPSPRAGEGEQESLPHGILYLSAYSGDRPDSQDSLHHPACQPLHQAWAEHGSAIAPGKTLRDWLRLSFFKNVHVGMYDQRPIYFPLSSEKKNFVAFIAIHRWADDTLTTLLADHLVPEQTQLDGEIADLLGTKAQGDTKTQATAEKRYTELMQLKTELDSFIQLLRQCAEVGPPPAKASDPPPETAAPYRMDLDDGVMINSAALWPLLAPHWAKPKTWWSELCTAKDRKDYDWSHLAARYFPARVDAKCQHDPSLAVAHGCFWRYHPAKAYEWELRLQDEIGPDFTIDEADSATLRQQFEAAHPQTVADLREKEAKRRERKYRKQAEDQLALPLTEE